jgi:predicted transcriptional regulator
MARAIIGITDWEKTRTELLNIGRRLDAGKRLPEADYRLNFPTSTALLEALPPKRLETLRVIRRSGALSVYALAKQLGRNYSNVHSDVQKLLELGLVTKDEAGRVLVPWKDVVVRMNSSLLVAA